MKYYTDKAGFEKQEKKYITCKKAMNYVKSSLAYVTYKSWMDRYPLEINTY